MHLLTSKASLVLARKEALKLLLLSCERELDFFKCVCWGTGSGLLVVGKYPEVA